VRMYYKPDPTVSPGANGMVEKWIQTPRGGKRLAVA